MDVIEQNATNCDYHHGFVQGEDILELLTEVLNSILRVSNKSGSISWKATEDLSFSTVNELVNHYVQQKRPIVPLVKNSVPIRPIKLQSWEFRHSDITVRQKLGGGESGEVCAGEALIGSVKKSVALKLAKQDTEPNILKERRRTLFREARIVRKFCHENIMKCYGIAVLNEPIMVVMEMITGKSVHATLLNPSRRIGLYEKVFNICLGAAKGLEYLHENQCLHRDIAARNILYSLEKVAKICDFGLSKIGERSRMHRKKRIPMKWTAPECFSLKVHLLKSDVYSFGVFMWEVFSDSKEPYEGLTNREVKNLVVNGKKLAKPVGCAETVYFAMQKCWELQPENRWSSKQVKEYLQSLATKLTGERTVNLVTQTQETKTDSVLQQPSLDEIAIRRPVKE